MMKQKTVGLTLRAFIIALALILVAGSPALPPFESVAYAQAAPQNLTATAAPNNASVSLSWNAVADADEYEVWRGDGSGSTVRWGSSAMATESGTTYTDSTVTAGNTYSYAVRAGSTGTFAVATVTLGGGTAAPTGAPTVTVAAASSTSTTVSWTAVSGATSYHIQFWHAGITDWEQISGDQTSPYTHTGLTAGTQYYYVVRGANAGGNGPWSNWRTDDSQVTLVATTTVPVITLDHQSRTVVQVSWTASAGGSRYDLQRKRVVTATNPTADPPTTTTLGTDATNGSTAWARLPSDLLTATSYTDSAANFVAPVDTTTAVHSVKYEYQVRAVDSADQAGSWSAVKSVTIPRAGVSLAAPTGLTSAEVTASNIRVTWNNVDGADYYQIQWKSGSGSYSTSIRVNRASGATSSYNDTGLTPSTKYTYRVRGVNINGVGDWAAELSRTTHSVTAAPGQMPKVTGLVVEDKTTSNTNTTGNRMVKLTWNAVSNATHYQIQRYNPAAATPAWANVTGDNVTGGRITKTTAGASPSWQETITTAENEGAGQTYFYVVSAIEDGVDDTVGNTDDEMGEWSDYKSVTFKAYKPAVPTGLAVAKTSGTSILIRWTASAVSNSDPHTGAADSYTLEWKASPGYSARTMTVNGTSYHHTGLSGTSTYKYRVKARNTGGESAYTTEEELVLGNTLGKPTNVRAVDASSGTGESAPKIKVSWSAVTGADSYEIQRFVAGDTNAWGNLAGTTDNSPATAVSGTSVTDDRDNDPSATNTGAALTAGTTYLYRVRTVKEGVKSGWSDTVSGTTKSTAATAPTLVATSIGMSTIRLTWDLVAGATGYEIEFLKGSYESNATFGAANLNRSKITISGGSPRNYVHAGRTAGTRYSYRIRAKLAQGYTGWSSAAEGATPIRQYTKPARPDLSATTAVSTTMTLKWDAVKFWSAANPGAEARLTDATNYQIQRREAGSSTWVAVTAGTTSCTNNKCMRTDGAAPGEDGALKKGTTYYYRIRAVSDDRDGVMYKSYWDYTNQRTSNR